MTSNYLAKYPFNGNAAQAQLSFPAGATIVARDGQEGKPWYWGNYMGKDGWFPPTYVTKVGGVQAAAAAAAPVSMQQKMAGASFASSVRQQPQQQQQRVQQQQPPNRAAQSVTSPAYGMSFGNNTPQQQQQNAFGATQSLQPAAAANTGFGIAAASGGFQSGAEDPFAALSATPPSLSGLNAAADDGSSSSLVSSPLPTSTAANSAPIRSSSQSSTLAEQTQTPTNINAGFNPFKNGSSFKSSSGTVAGNQNASSQRSIGSISAISAAASVSQRSVNGTSAGTGAAPLATPQSVGQQQQQQPELSPARIATSSAAAAVTQAASSFTSTISNAFANVSLTDKGKGVEAEPDPQLKHDKTQKQLIEEQMAKKKADEDARIHREKELEWERQMEAEKQRRLQMAESSAHDNKVHNIAAALPSPRAEGLGASGSTLSQLRPGEFGSTGPPVLHPRGKTPFFDPYAYLSDSRSEPTRKFNPIYRVQPFWALLDIDTYIRKYPPAPETQTTAAKYDSLAKAISFICHIVQENERFQCSRNGMDAPLSYLKANQLGMESCIKMIAALPHSAGASGKQLDSLFLTFINMFVGVVNKVAPHQQIVLPGGWQKLDGKGHLCLFILRNQGNEKFSFTVCNTGDGLQYHPSKFDQSSGLELKQMAMTIWDIPMQRLTDSSFWVLLFRMQVYPDKKNSAEFLYTKLLPALNSRPLWSNLDLGPSEFLQVPDRITRQNFHFLARLALTAIPVAGARPSQYSTLLLMNAAVDLAFRSIENAPPGSMDPEDTRILTLSGRNLSNFGSTLDANAVADGTLGSALSTTWEVLDKLLKKLKDSASKPMDQHSHGMSATALTDSFAKGITSSLKVEPGLACHPFFGRFRRDNYDAVVKELMGEQRPDPILIPAVLTDETMPSIATNYQQASSSLQRLCHACSLLLHQRQLVQNAPAFVASAAQYALTVTLPMPHLDPEHCFWRKNPMRRETQTNLLFLIRRMCRIYSAATTCVQQSRGLIAIRTTAFACAACISDAIVRVTACDDPSLFSLHYSGDCEGPTSPFGIEAGGFESLAANMPIFDAQYCSMRFQCLDYLRGISVKMDGSKRPTIFNYDRKMSPLKGDINLIDQLSIELALPRPYPPTQKALVSNAASLISGRNGLLLEVLPEMEFFRDIVFHFKHSVSGKAAAPTNVGNEFTWLPHHATLKWTTRPISSEDNTPIYSVTAFRQTVQEYVEIEVKQTSKSTFASFMSFFGKGKEERRKLSAADPTNIVNSCGEKFLKGK